MNCFFAIFDVLMWHDDIGSYIDFVAIAMVMITHLPFVWNPVFTLDKHATVIGTRVQAYFACVRFFLNCKFIHEKKVFNSGQLELVVASDRRQQRIIQIDFGWRLLAHAHAHALPSLKFSNPSLNVEFIYVPYFELVKAKLLKTVSPSRWQDPLKPQSAEAPEASIRRSSIFGQPV